MGSVSTYGGFNIKPKDLAEWLSTVGDGDHVTVHHLALGHFMVYYKRRHESYIFRVAPPEQQECAHD